MMNPFKNIGKIDFEEISDQESKDLHEFFMRNVLEAIEENEELDHIAEAGREIDFEQLKKQCDYYKEKIKRCCKNSFILFGDIKKKT